MRCFIEGLTIDNVDGARRFDILQNVSGFGSALRPKRACMIAKLAGLGSPTIDITYMRCQKDKGSHKALIEHYGKFPFEQCTTKLNQLAGILCWSKAKVENCLCEYSRAKIPTDYFGNTFQKALIYRVLAKPNSVLSPDSSMSDRERPCNTKRPLRNLKHVLQRSVEITPLTRH